MKQIVAFCEGDSNSLATWSNVPYLCLKAIENSGGGYQIERVNISFNACNPSLTTKLAQKIYSNLLRIYRYVFRRNTMLDYSRTLIYQNFVKTRMNQALECYADCYAQLVFDFSHVSTDRRSPIILLCDWSIEYKITEQWNRVPSKSEQVIINRQWEAMEKADAIVTLFPHSRDLLKQRFGDKVHYFGHIINAIEPYFDNAEKRFSSSEILFIGRPVYKLGLICLLNAVNLLNDKGMKLKINVIGMNKSDVDSNLDSSCCDFYGYLNKSDENQCRLYYDLIRSSKMLVNVTAGWNGVSSILEAIYYGLPVIVSSNEETKQIFSQDYPFVTACEAESVEETATCIQSICSLDEQKYTEVAVKGHEFASQFTWDKFSAHLMRLIEDIRRDSIE